MNIFRPTEDLSTDDISTVVTYSVKIYYTEGIIVSCLHDTTNLQCNMLCSQFMLA